MLGNYSGYGEAEVTALVALHADLRPQHPEIDRVWPFLPFVGPRFGEGLRLLYIGKATEGLWGEGDVRSGSLEELQAQTDRFVLEDAGNTYRLEAFGPSCSSWFRA